MPKNDDQHRVAPIARSTAGLRLALIEELDSLRNGEISEGRAHAVARLANAIISTVRLEIDMQALMQGADAPAPRALPGLSPIELTA